MGTINSLTGIFIGNTAKVNGGGIWNGLTGDYAATLTLSADSKDILFYSNRDKTGYNDIYQRSSSTINLNAKEGKRIIFNGTIMGNDTANKININAVSISNKYAVIAGKTFCTVIHDKMTCQKVKNRHCEDEVRRIQVKDYVESQRTGNRLPHSTTFRSQ